jgi:stringent starvation protein B
MPSRAGHTQPTRKAARRRNAHTKWSKLVWQALGPSGTTRDAGKFRSGWGREMDDSERPSKRDAFLALLRAGWASLHLDARSAGVVVPAPFSSRAHLVLQYGRNMPIAISDLEVTDAGVTATLSFSRIPHRTYVPWSAVYAVTCTNGCGVMYAEDIPADVAVAAPTDTGMANLGDPPSSPKSGYAIREDGPCLRAVPPEEDFATADVPIHMHSRRRRPQLRVVK